MDGATCEGQECKLNGKLSLYRYNPREDKNLQTYTPHSCLTAGQTGCSATVECVSTAECDAADSTCKAKGE